MDTTAKTNKFHLSPKSTTRTTIRDPKNSLPWLFPVEETYNLHMY